MHGVGLIPNYVRLTEEKEILLISKNLLIVTNGLFNC